MGKEQESNQDASKDVNIPFNVSQRSSLYDSYKQGQESSEAQPVTKEPAADAEIVDKSASEAPSVEQEPSDSPSVKEEPTLDKPVSKEKEDNVKKALHEEREKRKEANRRLRELRTQYDARLTDMQSKIDLLSKAPSESNDGFLNDPLKAEVEKLKIELHKERQQKEQDAVVKGQKELQDRIKRVSSELKQNGFPGFDLALLKVDAEISKRVTEGDLLPEEAKTSETWKQVYMETVYPEVAAEFKAVQKKETIQDKVNAKKKAGLVGSPGSNPSQDVRDPQKEPETMEEFNKKFFEQRRASSPNKSRR